MAKFKVKDFVTDGKEVFRVTEIKNNSYILYTQNDYCSVLDINKVDANFHLVPKSIKEEDKELIIKWFEHIAQIADNRKTINNVVMPDWEALNEIKCKAKDAAEYIRRYC